MREYIIRKYRIPPERLPGKTLLGKLRGHALIARAHLSSISSPNWEQDVVELFDDALRLRDPEVFSRVLEAVRKSYNTRLTEYEKEGPYYDHRYGESVQRMEEVLRRTFLLALNYGDDQAVRLLLQYYSPAEDLVLKQYLDTLIAQGDPFANELILFIYPGK